MSRRFFTSDFHLYSKSILNAYNRPFKSIEDMNYKIIKMCNSIADSTDDIIIHCGDLCEKPSGINLNPNKFISDNLIANFINIKGNHDNNNRVKSLCNSMRTHLGKVFPDVSISHFPSTDKRSKNQWLPGDIHLCGHIHNKWKYLVDQENMVLNINTCLEVWDYKLVSEEKLIKYITKILMFHKFS